MSSLKLCETLSSIALRTWVVLYMQCDTVWCHLVWCLRVWIMRRFRIDPWQISCGKRSNRGKILPAIDFNPRPRLSSPASANCLLVSEIIVYLDQKPLRLSSSTGHSFQGYQLPAIILMGGDYNPTCGWLLLRSILTPKPRLCWPGPTDKGGQVDSAGSNQSRHMGEVHR